jgi:hypothetical protein
MSDFDLGLCKITSPITITIITPNNTCSIPPPLLIRSFSLAATCFEEMELEELELDETDEDLELTLTEEDELLFK